MKTLGLAVCVIVLLTVWVVPVRADEPVDLVDYLLKVRDGGSAVIAQAQKADIWACRAQWKKFAQGKATWESLPDYCRDDNAGKASAVLFVAGQVKDSKLRKPFWWRAAEWEAFVQFVTQ